MIFLFVVILKFLIDVSQTKKNDNGCTVEQTKADAAATDRNNSNVIGSC